LEEGIGRGCSIRVGMLAQKSDMKNSWQDCLKGLRAKHCHFASTIRDGKEKGLMKKTLIVSVIAGILVVGSAQTAVLALDYPAKPVTMINPNAPGGLFDVIGRTFASAAERVLGQPVIVVNKPGAGNLVGGLAGAQAAPDGYTLMMISTGLTNGIEWETANGRKSPVARQDFIPIGCIVSDSPLVVVAYDSAWKTLADFINDCRAKPDHYAFSSGGLYGGSHLPAEVLMRGTGIKARHVPYQGGGPALAAVVGKHVDFATQYLPSSLPLIKGNKMRALAVQSDKRIKVIPDVPTVRELGVDAEYYNWIGIGVPKKTPKDLVERLGEMMVKVTQDKSFVETLGNAGEEVYFMDGEKLAKHWDSESERIGKLMRELVKEAPKK
jgi:tripartite-type tricarboxylate transporter receptor subunit TctC